MSDQAINQATLEWRQGNQEEARKILIQALNNDPYNEKLLITCASVASTKKISIDLLKRVLEINPNNEKAKKKLAELEGQSLDSEQENHESNHEPEKIISDEVVKQMLVTFLDQQKTQFEEQQNLTGELLSAIHRIHEEQFQQGKKISNINTVASLIGILIILSICGVLFTNFS